MKRYGHGRPHVWMDTAPGRPPQWRLGARCPLRDRTRPTNRICPNRRSVCRHWIFCAPHSMQYAGPDGRFSPRLRRMPDHTCAACGARSPDQPSIPPSGKTALRRRHEHMPPGANGILGFVDSYGRSDAMRSLDYMVARYAWAQSHTVFHSVLRCNPHRTIPIPLDAHPASLAQAPFARRNCRIGRFSAAALERASAHAPAGACGPYKGPACRPGSCPGVRTPGKSGECRADGGAYARGRPGKARMFGPVVHLAHPFKPFPSHSGHLGGQSAAEVGGVPVRAIRMVFQTLPPRRHDLVVPAETAGNLHDSPAPLHRARPSNRLGLYSGRRG